MFEQIVAIGLLIWFLIVTVVTIIGTIQIFRHYSEPPQEPNSTHLGLEDVPHVTIIRPCTGIEPFLYDCLAATFHQNYPLSKFTVCLCVPSKSDTAYSTLRQLVQDYPEHDTRIYVEDEDVVLRQTGSDGFGPNPKIRNMSRAYREAKGDLIWILDCNIWMGYGALGRTVDKLCGFATSSDTGQEAQTQRPYKLVAHLPVCVDVDDLDEREWPRSLRSASAADDPSVIPLLSTSTASVAASPQQQPLLSGSMLETAFLSTAHAKMYVAINSVGIAPCINGKSTMFRRSHLNHLTRNQGIDHFSHNICEDHLIGDLLWKSYIPPRLDFDSDRNRNSQARIGDRLSVSNPRGLDYRNHGLAVGDLAIQPVARMSLASYIARRVRWLRVRKFTVMLATLVEPGTESLVCCLMAAFSFTTLCASQPWFGSTWTSTFELFVVLVINWVIVDWFVSGVIQKMRSVETSEDVVSDSSYGVKIPPFASPVGRKTTRWISAWIGREVLALAIWTWAIWGGTTVTWREKRFRVGMDMRVHELHTMRKPIESARDDGRTRSGINVASADIEEYISETTIEPTSGSTSASRSVSKSDRTRCKDGKIE